MAEKSPSRKRPPARQQMLENLAEAEKSSVERRDAEARPEDRLEAKTVREAVATAEALSTDGVVKSIGELKATVGRTLTQLSDRLEEEVAKYVQIQRAIAAKSNELKEIFDIQKSAATLTALIELHDRKREQLEREHAEESERIDRERDEARAEWDQERKAREVEIKERDSIEQKRREREKEEFNYRNAREQQQARDAFADEQAKAEKELAARKSQLERELAEREERVGAAEQEVNALRQRVEAFPRDQESLVSKAVAQAVGRSEQDSAAKQELLRREFAGERNVLTTKISSLEEVVKEQAAQIARLSQQAEKAYGQVQEIAVRAIEGSSNSKSLTNLQQMLADQVRKPAGER